jgi:c-di-GMP-binding flagellar brake protein YcgR
MNTITHQHMNQAPLPLPEPEGLDHEDFRVHDRFEIIGILREIIERRSLVTLDFGGDFIVTNLLALNTETGELFFDVAQDESTNTRIRAAARLLFVTLVDNIKTQFEAQRAESTSFESHPALRTRMPASVLRLQRRNHFRVKAPRTEPLACTIPMPDGTIASFVIGDLSVSGIAVLAGPDLEAFQPGAIFNNCRIELPEEGVITTSIEVRNLVPTRPPGVGGGQVRFGCRFLKLAGTVESLLQRYINHLERRRRALL